MQNVIIYFNAKCFHSGKFCDLMQKQIKDFKDRGKMPLLKESCYLTKEGE